MASSFISLEQAELNLKRELGDNTFDETRPEAKEIWNRELGRLEVEGGTLAQYQNFYTAFYRTLLFPRRFFEIDRNDAVIHYSPYNGKVLPGYMYTDNGFRDTFRAAFPVNALLYPKQNAQNYRNVFCPDYRLMRGRKNDGSWSKPFNPFKWGGDFTEGNSWQYTWLVPHDPQGLIDLFGSEEAFIKKLDALFVQPSEKSNHASADISGLIGQYAHGNEPVGFGNG